MQNIQIARMPTLYGHCDCIKALRGGEQIARAGRSGLTWLIVIDGRDDFDVSYRMELSPASDSNTAVLAKTRDEIYADVEALLLRQIARYDALLAVRAA
jgi:hypothetical protein